jgi:hypothetical protein
VEVVYGAFTKPMRRAEGRLFGIDYHDGREPDADNPPSAKVDNRPLPVRLADDEDIRVATLGAHYISTFNVGNGTGDFTAWGALQRGDWGTLDHKGYAFALELGYQPRSRRLKPWIRAGYHRSSGDDNPADGDHETFFQVLPTPRPFARFPLFNQMNNGDLFIQGIIRPTPRLALRADVHRLRLSKAADLWYQGGGAFQDESFGYAGRPSGGNKNLATLFDISADYQLSQRTALSLYFGYADGKEVISSVYPAGASGTFGYIEMTRRF